MLLYPAATVEGIQEGRMEKGQRQQYRAGLKEEGSKGDEDRGQRSWILSLFPGFAVT